MHAIPGFLRATGFVTDNDEAGRPRRVSFRQFEPGVDFETYLAGPVKKMWLRITEAFPKGINVTQRLFWQFAIIDDNIQPKEMCLSCGTFLAGQYCGNCRQRLHNKLISIWEFVRDMFGDDLELGSHL